MYHQEEIVTPTPTDLWEKKLVSESSLWFLSPGTAHVDKYMYDNYHILVSVKLHKAITDVTDTEVKEEVVSIGV